MTQGALGHLHHDLGNRAIEMTDNATGDAAILPCLLDQIGENELIASISDDGAYDAKCCHNAIAQRGARNYSYQQEWQALEGPSPACCGPQ